MNKTIGLKLLIMVFILFSGTLVRAEVINIDNVTLQSMLDQGIPIIDVRRDDEWHDTGVINSSHLLTFFDAQGNYDEENWIKNLDSIVSSDEPFILICRSGNRTRMISQWLRWHRELESPKRRHRRSMMCLTLLNRYQQ